MSRNKEIRTEVCIAILLVLAVFFVGFFYLDNVCYWGDDFAAYISEGIAIADGTLQEQVKLNAKMHPSYLPEQIRNGELMYVWGYPLILAAVYKIVGFDRVNFDTIVYYKIPSLLALAFLAGVVYFFMRRRFDRKYSIFLTVFLCMYGGFFDFIDTLYSDIVFLFFSTLSLLLIELRLDSNEKKTRILLGAVLGVSLWYTYEVRLNGIAIVFAAVAAQIFDLLHNKKNTEKYSTAKHKQLLVDLIPYIVFAVMVGVSDVVFPAPTKDSGISIWLFKDNLKYYFEIIRNFFGLVLINPIYAVIKNFVSVNYTSLISAKDTLGLVAIAICIIGVIWNWRKEIYLCLLMLVYYVAACLLPYQQGIRYVFPLLPIFVLLFGYGIRQLYKLVLKCIRCNPKRELTGIVVCVACSMLFTFPMVEADVSACRGKAKDSITSEINGGYRYDIYSEVPVEVYNYIRQNTPEDCTIGFYKPRALFLNTERFSVPMGVNGHTLDETDYCLTYRSDIQVDTGFTCVYSNGDFVLYRNDTRSAENSD